jgi:phosphoglycerate kinase
MDKMTVRDIDVSGKRVLVRVDFNVPMDDKTGAINDDSRIQATIPTIRYLIRRKAKIILVSHLGRPGGKVVDNMRLMSAAQRLSQILGRQVGVATDCIGPEVEKSVKRLKNGDVMLLENVRFHPEEEANDPAFAETLSKLADFYVNDAFGAAHRTHASTVGVTGYLPAVAGLLLEKEIYTLGGILNNPARPFAMLVGGAKVGDKIDLIENILDKVNTVLIGGGMAATFLKGKGFSVGNSIIENDRLELVIKLMNKVEKNGVRFILPVDVVVADAISEKAHIKTVSVNEIPEGWSIVDIGSQTIRNFLMELAGCRTVCWNGPMGVYEIPRFAEGTESMAMFLAALNAKTVVGGGSTAEIVIELGLAGKMSFVSTGGGASLQFLSGKVLPGLEALMDKKAEE